MRIIRKKLERMVADKCLLPKTEKYDAVHYMLNEWDGLMNIFTRGDYHLDNNLVERLNRYISLSRRNSLFFGSHTGARRAAMFYSLACLAKTEHSHPLGMVVSTHFRCGKGVKRGLKNGALPFTID